jgi:hypothetical protein
MQPAHPQSQNGTNEASVQAIEVHHHHFGTNIGQPESAPTSTPQYPPPRNPLSWFFLKHRIFSTLLYMAYHMASLKAKNSIQHHKEVL